MLNCKVVETKNTLVPYNLYSKCKQGLKRQLRVKRKPKILLWVSFCHFDCSTNLRLRISARSILHSSHFSNLIMLKIFKYNVLLCAKQFGGSIENFGWRFDIKRFTVISRPAKVDKLKIFSGLYYIIKRITTLVSAALKPI